MYPENDNKRIDASGDSWTITLYYTKYAPYSWIGHRSNDKSQMTSWDINGVSQNNTAWNLLRGFNEQNSNRGVLL